MLLYERLRSLPSTARRLAANLKDYSRHNLIELAHELDAEDGWSEIVSLGSTQKGWIHKFIDNHYQLRRLFRKVRRATPPLLPATSYNNAVSYSSIAQCSHLLILRALQPGTGGQRSDLLLYSEKAVRRTEQVLVNLSFCLLVLGPIFLLSFVANQVAKLCIVLGFVMATSVLASVLSDNTQKSGLAVMAGSVWPALHS